jgi:ElaA protein
MNLTFQTKQFKALSVSELYSILKLRSEVFVVEQNCVYLDIDGKDQKALHVLGFLNDEIVAYTRIFKPKDYFENASIGRVVIDPKHRDKKWGNELMKSSILAIKTNFEATKITISAQLYLLKFYQQLGFIATSETYLEDDIPHIEMQIIN